MDHLLGAPLSEIQMNYSPYISILEKIKNGKDIIGIEVFTTNRWRISSDMINYEPIEIKIKKILKL